MESAGLDERFAEPRLLHVFADLNVFGFPKEVVHASGWYGEEATGESAWRWTGQAAVLSVVNPGTGATLHLDYTARVNVFAEAPQVVTISVGNEVLRSFVADAGGRQSVRVPVTAAALGLGERAEMRISVDRTFVPANVRADSRDTRELGIQVHRAELVSDTHMTVGGQGRFGPSCAS